MFKTAHNNRIIKKHYFLFLIAALFFLINITKSQTCDLDIKFFKEKILKNYAGFSLLEDKLLFEKFADSLNNIKLSCSEKLQQLQYYFDDLHLIVYKYREALKYEKAIDKLVYRRTKDEIAGLWINERKDKIILIRRTQSNQYDGIIVKAQKETLEKGLIYYKLKALDQNKFEIKINTADFSSFCKAKLNSSGQLVVGLYDKWYRTNINNTSLNKVNWEPTIKADQQTVLIKVPDCSLEATAILDSLLKAKETSINKAVHLIIDLRDNAGGTLLGLDLLLPYFDIDTVISAGSTIICSDDNITAFEEGISMISEFGVPQKIIDQERRILANMIKNKGAKYNAPPDTTIIQKKFSKPKKIAVLINYRTASSAEMFVLKAMQSKNVTVLGEPTTGALKTVEMSSYFSKDSLTEITIPAVALAVKGKKNVVNGSYIKPDITLTSKDWINETKKYLKKSVINL